MAVLEVNGLKKVYTTRFGGSRVQIGGPTGAFAVIVFNVIEKFQI